MAVSVITAEVLNEESKNIILLRKIKNNKIRPE